MIITSRNGKQYKSEKAIIALTSWTGRIKSAGLTIFNLWSVCPGFHIVLTLSDKEFPNKEASLPSDLQLMLKAKIFEIVWVSENYKSLKKVLYAMSIYSNIPIISADDDCIYICNYAEILYNKWILNQQNVIKYTNQPGYNGTQGPSTLYPPCIFKILLTKFQEQESSNVLKFSGMDDAFLSNTIISANVPILSCSSHYCFRFHDESNAIHPNLKSIPLYNECYSNSLAY